MCRDRARGTVAILCVRALIYAVVRCFLRLRCFLLVHDLMHVLLHASTTSRLRGVTGALLHACAASCAR